MSYIGKTPTSVPLTSSDITDGIITSAKIADGAIVNDDINASAGVVFSKLASTGTLTVDNIQFPDTYFHIWCKHTYYNWWHTNL
jgi:hypothetical protein